MSEYDPRRQFRATIIRGKAKTEMDNLLPAYAGIISDICPVDLDEFDRMFDARLHAVLPEASPKTLANHRTEIAGKLFGMYYTGSDHSVHTSERMTTFLENHDQPFFFKDICFKFQFPNGMDSVQTVREKVDNKLSLRQFPYILRLMELAAEVKERLTKDEVAYYVLNSLDVLQGTVSPETVLAAIFSNRQKRDFRRVRTPGKAPSYDMQHINEQLNLLELADLVRIQGGELILNDRESTAIAYFAEEWDKPPLFDVAAHDLSDAEGSRQFFLEWDSYYSQLSPEARRQFPTDIKALEFKPSGTPVLHGVVVHGGPATIELGDEGESYVYEKERERVAAFDPRLAKKVRQVGRTKGLGYDIQSVVAEAGDAAEFARYIEVKSTKRVTAPDRRDVSWTDNVGLTRQEWVAAQQFPGCYFIYRVYFTTDGPRTFIIGDPCAKVQEKKMAITPRDYTLDFGPNAVDGVMEK